MKEIDWIYGIHAVTTLLERAPERVNSLLLQSGKKDTRTQKIIDLAKTLGLAVEYASAAKLDALAPAAVHQGVLARCLVAQALNEADLTAFVQALKQPAFLLILDSVQDPHNLGACLRTADAAGVHAVITSRSHSVGLTPAVRKVACGAAETVPFFQVGNLARTLRDLKEQGIWLVGTIADTPNSVYQTDLKGPIAFVLGNEGEGLRPLTQSLCDLNVHIPMHGSVSSLNVSVAAAVCLYEGVRQRT